MANCCYIEISAKFINKNTYHRQKHLLHEIIKKAERNNKYADIGMVDNWLADGNVIQTEKSLCLTGNVRWGLTDEQAVSLVTWFKERKADELVIDYEELSNCVCGTYIYANNQLSDNYLPETDPFWDQFQDGDKSYCDLPEKNFKKRIISLK